MRNMLEELKKKAFDELDAVTSGALLEGIRVRYLGKKGEITAILKNMGRLPDEERPVIGAYANDVRAEIEEKIASKHNQLTKAELGARIAREKLDVTLPGRRRELGRRHPMTVVLDEVRDVFLSMGFEIAEGPEVDTEYYNFTALNHSKGHPARDMQDTFYISEEVLLRTQTSTVQIHVMENRKPPLKVISPGRVFRKDEVDATHSPMFHQIEGLVVDRGITMADLKGTLETLVKRIYGADAVIRFRPHHFPFTEPSAEVDIMCFSCHGSGCRLCKGEGWIELLGCGMVHPNVLSGCGIDPEIYSGFAFGVGLDRMTLRRFNISDLRLLFENDMRFLSQF